MKNSTRHLTLGGILALSAILYGWALGSRGWGNSYYSAAVKSMGQSWTNFLFGSYDPAGVVTIDKPPAALWPQVLSAKIFGLHGWSVLLPQVIEGVLTVWLLYLVVRRWAGNGAGLVAAAVLTVTPITVAIDRDNNPDTLLVLLLVAAAYALTRALQAGSSRTVLGWLCLCGLLIGAGFLTKMLAAWMVVPAFAAAWLIGASGRWWQRLWRLAVAGVVLAASSLWWVALVAVWPGDRPFIGGSTDGTAWDLVVGYNGLGRVFGEGEGAPGGGMGGGISFGGAAGWDRLFNDVVAGQISWLLPACGAALVVAVVVALLHRKDRLTGTPLSASGWVLWGGWLIVCGAVFSTQQGIFHPYYTSQLSPAVGALCGGLVVTLRRAHQAGARWVLPASATIVAGTAAWAVAVIGREPSWYGWLRWVVLAVAVAAITLLILALPRRRLLPVAAGLAAVAVLLTPTLWSASVTWAGTGAMNGTNPTAGPSGLPFGRGGGPRGFTMPAGGFPGGPGDLPGMGGLPGGQDDFPGGPGSGPGLGGDTLTEQQRKVLDYAVRGSGDARITLAVDGGAMRASAFILTSDATVIGMGGFGGMDDAPSVGQLQDWVSDGELRYVLASGMGLGMGPGGGAPGAGMGFGGGAAQKRTEWIEAHCTEVPAAEYGESDATSTLYDCGPNQTGTS